MEMQAFGGPSAPSGVKPLRRTLLPAGQGAASSAEDMEAAVSSRTRSPNPGGGPG